MRRLEGHPAEVHARPLPEVVGRQVTVVVATAPALVLGSTQADTHVDRDEARRRGLAVVRRRSGGGAVLVEPGDPLWVEVDLPAGDPLWTDDVGRSFLWLGRVWAAALGELGVAAQVREGPLEAGPWGRAVCFAGRGPGEVLAGGAKVVGLAQRRTRHGARLQGAVLRHWDPRPLVDLVLAPDQRDAAAAALAGAGLGVDVEAALEAFLARLGA